MALLLAGTIEGLLGLGIAFVAAPMLSLFVDIPAMVTLLALPTLLSNIWQAFPGGHVRESWRRMWPLILCRGIGAGIGAWLPSEIDTEVLFVLLGGLVSAVAISGLTGATPHVAGRWEGAAGPIVGFAAGIVGGMSTMFGPIVTVCVAHLRLDKDRLVVATALIYVASGSLLVSALRASGMMTRHAFAASLLAAAPV